MATTPRFVDRAPAIGLLTVVALTVFGVTGCGRQVSVTPPADPPAACAALAQNLPDTLDGAGRRPTTPDSPATAAWGEPPIVMRCGVPRPAAATPTAVLLEVDTIGWLPEPLDAGIVFTSIDWPTSEEPIYIEVAIPDAYASPGSVVADLTSALTLTSTRP